MTRKVTIKGATLRDVSWIMANLRPKDLEEVKAQYAAPLHHLAAQLIHNPGGGSYVAYVGRVPVAVYGWSPLTDRGVSIWALGARGMWRAVPTITRHMLNDVIPYLWKIGVRWGEARSIVTHKAAHRWMEGTGARPMTRLPDYGNGGEEFILYRWTWRDFPAQVPEIKRRLEDA